MTRRGRIRAVALAVAVGVALAGCVAIPTSGDVSPFDVERQGEGGAVPFLPSPPAPGASQVAILEGFLRAGVGPQESYRVAREFLATDFAARWSPNEQVSVTDGARGEPEQVDDDTLVSTVFSVATVDAAGVLSVLPAPTEQTLAFDFVQEDGEWRISSAPNVVVLSRSTFGEIFRDFPLYFFDPSGDYLVPDLRWFPALPTSGERSTTGERLVRSVLDGPVSWLGTGVVSAFAPDTQLPAEFLRIVDGVATVDLPSQVLAESAAVKRRMREQLEAAMVPAVDGVREVRLTVGRFPMQIPDGSGAAPSSEQLARAAPAGLRDGVFGELRVSAVDPLPGLGSEVAALEPVAATISRDRSAAAVLSAGRDVWALRAAADSLIVDDRGGLIGPTIDPAGYVWSVPIDEPAGIRATGADGEPHAVPLTVGAPAGSTITAFTLSRDGTRLLLGLQTPAGQVLQVLAVTRNADLVPIGLGTPLAVASGALGPLIDAAWVDSAAIAVLIDQESGPVVRSVAIGGRSAPLGSVPGAVQLVGGNGLSGLRALDADGMVFARTGAGTWSAGGITASLLATQQ